MPKQPVLTPQVLMKILEKKGFVCDRVKGSHYIFYHPDSKKRVVVPFHRGDLPAGTVHEILKEAGVKREELDDLL
jgi:predicted RNA binding protein YcfA (HicA-like mRNA interferase family)